MRLSPHFTLDEMILSQTAVRAGIENEPGQREIERLTFLCESVLEPIRNNFGKPVVVSSGYRCPQLNVLIGGSPSSRHVYGEAADIVVPGIPISAIVQYIVDNLTYDQVIDEFSRWVHVGTRLFGHGDRSEALRATRVGASVRYEPWQPACVKQFA